MKTFRSHTTVRASPEHVIDTLTDADACARWSPIPFSLDDGHTTRLSPGTSTRVCGHLLGAPVGFELRTIAADPTRLRLRARGPIEIRVVYALRPAPVGCAVEAAVSVRPLNGHFGQVLARATQMLLAGGTLDRALGRMAQEAERAARAGTPAAPGPGPAIGGDRESPAASAKGGVGR